MDSHNLFIFVWDSVVIAMIYKCKHILILYIWLIIQLIQYLYTAYKVTIMDV